MKKVKTIVLSKLVNFEVRQLMEDVIKILGSKNIEEMHLQDIFDILTQQELASQSLTTPYGKHELTPKLAQLHKKRLMYASLLNSNVKALLNVHDKEMQRMALVARRLTKKRLTYLGQIKREFVDDKLYRFFLVINAPKDNPEIMAFKALGLEPYLNELNSSNNEYHRLNNKRKKDIEERPKTGDPVVRKDSLWILRMFFEKVNTNQRIYKDVDYSQLVHELNLLLTANSKRIKTRIATNKRKAGKKAQAAKEVAAQKSNPPQEPTKNSTSTPPKTKPPKATPPKAKPKNGRPKKPNP